MRAMAGFELWDSRSGNLVADYGTEAQALVALAAALDRHGEAYADTLYLVAVFPSGDLERVAFGAELAQRARAQQHTPA